ncbi:MAG TPA: hypothetical protein VN796_02160 [Acidimicrobiales bacterium]|nr:hypothetical protein [Acidimicrobiales bacterium]
MSRKLATVIAIVVCQVGFIVGVSGVAAAAPALSGNVTCSSFVGTGTFGPKLTLVGSPGGVKITYKGTLSACTGGSINFGGAIHTVTGGRVKASGYFTGVTGSKCANFQGAIPADSVGKIKMKVTWTLSPPLAVVPSKVTYGLGGPYKAPVAGVTMSLEMGAVPVTPTVVAGSYAGSIVQDTVMGITVPLAGCPVGPPFVFPVGTMTF